MDRAQVIQGAKQHWAGHEDETLLARMDFQAGDVLQSVPAATSDKDIYMLSAVLHCFDDDTCVKALKNLARACGDTGARIAVMEVVMAGQQPDLASAVFDMQMFMGTRGRERSIADWLVLFERSDLLLEEVVGLQSFGKILVLRPNQ